MKIKVGNVAKLREAVVSAIEHLESHGVGEDTYEYLNEHVGTDGDCPLVKLHKQLKNALALPRRNCDRYSDVDSAYEQFMSYVSRENPVSIKASPLHTVWDALKWVLGVADCETRKEK